MVHDFPVRGVSWVLKRAATVGVLAASGAILLNFAYRLAAEQVLTRAAAIGVRAAALPRATHRSVERAIHRELAGAALQDDGINIALQSAGKPIKGPIEPRARGAISVALSAPAATMLPSWLSALAPWDRDSKVAARAEEAR
jgi:hypothetical protein